MMWILVNVPTFVYFLMDDVNHGKKYLKEYPYINIEITTHWKKCSKFEVVQNTFLSTVLAGLFHLFLLFFTRLMILWGDPSKSATAKFI